MRLREMYPEDVIKTHGYRLGYYNRLISNLYSNPYSIDNQPSNEFYKCGWYDNDLEIEGNKSG